MYTSDMSVNQTRILVVFFIAALAAVFSQSPTNIPPGQLRGASSPNGRINLVLPSGFSTQALLGQGLSIDTSGPIPVLRAAAASPPEFFGVRPAFVSPKSFTIPNAYNPATLRVYLNGIRQALTEDYTVSGQTITFGSTWTTPMGSEVVQIDYVAP